MNNKDPLLSGALLPPNGASNQTVRREAGKIVNTSQDAPAPELEAQTAEVEAERQPSGVPAKAGLGDNRGLILFALWVPFIFTLAVVFLAHEGQHASDIDARWVLHTVEVKDQVEHLNSLVRDIGAGDRGYLSAGETSSLPLNEYAGTAIPSQIDRLAELIKDNPRQVAAVVNLRTLIAEKSAIAARALSLAQQEKVPEMIEIDKDSRWKSLNDEIRAQIEAMTAEENRLLVERESTFASQVKAQRNKMIGLVGVEITLIVCLTLLLLRLRKLQQTADKRIEESHATTDHAQASTLTAIARTEKAEARVVEADTRTEEAQIRGKEGIRTSEIRYRRLFETAQDGIIVLDAGTGQIVDANPYMQKLLGYSHEEMSGQKLWEMAPFRETAGSKIAFANLAQSGRIQKENLFLETKDGRKIQVEFMSNAYRMDGNLLVQCNIRDITERKKAEQDLTLLHTCIAHLNDIVLITEADSTEEPGPRIVFANEAFERMTGYTYAETLGRSPRFLQGPKTDRRILDEIHQAVGEQKPIRRQIINYRKDGSEFWLDIDIVPIFDAAGKCTHFAGIERDITEDKKTRESLDLFRTLMDRSPDAIEVVDATTGRFLHVNATGCQSLGYSLEEMRTLSLSDVIVPGDSPFSMETNVRDIRKTGVKIIETRHRRKDGSTFPSEVHTQYIDLDQGYLVAVVRDITERKQLEETRRATEERYRTLFNYAPDGILIVSPENIYIDANVSICEMLGYNRDELIGLGIPEILAETELPRVEPTLSVIRSNTDHHREWKFRRKDGSIVEVEAFSRLMPDGNVLAMIRDITDRKRNEARFRRLVDSNAQSVMFWNTKGEITGSNDAFLHLVRYTREDLEAGRLGWATITAPEYADADRLALEEIALTGACAPYEKEFIRKDGVRVPVLIGGAGFEDNREEGVAFMLDLTERKCAAEQIAEQASLLDEAQDAIIVRDLIGRVIFWNKGAERIYGWSRQEVLGVYMSDILFANPKAFTEINALTISQGKWSGDLQHFTKDKRQITVEARWTLIRDAEGQPKSVLAINTDVTDKKKIEAQFMRAQRMESIGTLAGGIAHDLNNILAPIMMSIDILKLTATDPQAQSILNTIEVSSKRGSDIVRQVLSFARGLEGERVEIQPTHILKDLESIIKNTFPKNIRLQFAIPNDTWLILGDPTQVHQILLNLCVNARDAMPNGGNLSFGVENCVLDEQYAAMQIDAKPGRYVCINVTDTGTGIPQGILDKIFEPFFTTKEMNEGTGLGLSTVMAIVKSHQGIIDVYSETGRGTTFKVYLPAMELSAEAQKLVTQQTSVPRGNGETILVVDDEAAILTITSQTLQAFGYRVLSATDGAEAVAVYAKCEDEIAVVLTDMSMPIMDGAAVIRALTKINPAIKIIAASGLNANGEVAKVSGLAVQRFLTKPYTSGTLLKMMRSTLDEN